MEIYCHPVANGTYYFSGACSSTGRCHIGPAVFPGFPTPGRASALPSLSIVDAHSLGCDSTSTLQYARCLPLPLPHITFILFCVRTRLTPSLVHSPPPPHAVACVLCMFSQRWSLKACNVPLPHSTAFFLNTSIYSSFGQLPKKKKRIKKKLQRNVCKKVPIHSSTSKLQPTTRIRNPGQYSLPISMQLPLAQAPESLISLSICFCGCQRQLLFGPESRVLCAKVPCILARN